MGKIITCKYCGTTKEVRQHAETCGSGTCRMRKHREVAAEGKSLEELCAPDTFEDLAAAYKDALEAHREAQKEADSLHEWVEVTRAELEALCSQLGLNVTANGLSEPRTTLTESALQLLNAKYAQKEKE